MPSVTDDIFTELRSRGYTGTLADMQRQYLAALATSESVAASGSLADFKRALGVSQNNVFPLEEEAPAYVSPWPSLFPSVLSQMTFSTSPVGGAPNLGSGWSFGGTNTDFLVEAGPLVTYGDASTEGRNLKLVSGASSYRRMEYTQAASAGPRMIGFYFELNEVPSQTLYLTRQLIANTTNRGDWRINTNRTVSIRDGNTAVATSAQTLAVGTPYWSEWLVNGATQTLRIYEVDSKTPLISLTGAITNGLADTLLVGHMVNLVGHTTYFDRVILHNDWIRVP